MPVPGDKYCRLTLLREIGSDGNHVIWSCLCDCGEECTARSDKLKFGRKKSCGCLKRELAEAAKAARTVRITADERLIREAAYERDKLKLKSLLKVKGKIDFQNFDFTGPPRRVAREFREWAFIVSGVLKYGPSDDSVTITAGVKVNKADVGESAPHDCEGGNCEESQEET